MKVRTLVLASGTPSRCPIGLGFTGSGSAAQNLALALRDRGIAVRTLGLIQVLAVSPSNDARYRLAMTITAVLDIQLRLDAPADAETRVSSILSQTRARPGFLSADVVRDLDDPRHLVVIEVWESFEADQAYRAWRATPEGASELGELTGGRTALTRYEPTTI